MTLHENQDYIRKTCKIGQGAGCCKYLVMGKGFECMRDNPESFKL